MGLREDDPVYYKVKMQQLIDKARKNGLRVDFSIYDGPKERTVKVLFKAPEGDCAGATIMKRRK